jgi:hypothetical protein
MKARNEMMSRIRAIALLLAISFPGQQTSAAEPGKPPELKVLERFVGTWDVEAITKPTVWTPTEKREKCVEYNELVLDGWFLHGSSKSVDGKISAIVMNTYDPVRKEYRIRRFTPGGLCDELTGQWDEAASTLTVRGDLGHGITLTAAFHLTDEDHREYHVVAKDGDGKVYFDVQATVTRRKSLAAKSIEKDGSTQDTKKSKEDHVPAKSLGHASRQLLIDGWTRDRVEKTYGKPKETKRSQFTVPKYGNPKSLPEMDEQWYFSLEMGHRLVCFKQGKVVLAIEEWSDF